MPQDRQSSFEPQVLPKHQKDITDKLLPRIEEWQNRPLSPVYPIVFIDEVHFSVRDDGVIRKLATYVVLGINEEGMKEVRTAFYTTNAIESLNSFYRRLNKQRSVFPSSQALMKALYLGTFEVAKKWTMPIRNWGKVCGELEIMYPDRMLI